MDLRGSLAVFEPVVILQLMNLSQATGELAFETKTNAARVYFSGGALIYAEIESRKFRLGDYLVANNLLSRNTMDVALSERKKGELIGAALLRLGAIDTDVLSSAIEEQMKEVIYEVVRWRRGSFVFRSGREPQNRDVVIGIPLDHLMLEGVKRMDEESGER